MITVFSVRLLITLIVLSSDLYTSINEFINNVEPVIESYQQIFKDYNDAVANGKIYEINPHTQPNSNRNKTSQNSYRKNFNTENVSDISSLVNSFIPASFKNRR